MILFETLREELLENDISSSHLQQLRILKPSLEAEARFKAAYDL